MIIPIGILRSLQQCTSLRCTIPYLALNHRQNLRKGFNPVNPSAVSTLSQRRSSGLKRCEEFHS
jgi:hypothetical protein